MSWHQWRELQWMSLKFGLACLAGFISLVGLLVIAYFLRLRSERQITLSEFKKRLNKLLS